MSNHESTHQSISVVGCVTGGVSYNVLPPINSTYTVCDTSPIAGPLPEPEATTGLFWKCGGGHSDQLPDLRNRPVWKPDHPRPEGARRGYPSHQPQQTGTRQSSTGTCPNQRAG